MYKFEELHFVRDNKHLRKDSDMNLADFADHIDIGIVADTVVDYKGCGTGNLGLRSVVARILDSAT